MMTRRQLHVLGGLVLLLGLGSATLVYRSGEDPSKPSRNPGASSMEYENQDFTLSLEDSKKASRDMEIYYGKLGLVVAKWSSRLEELKRPGPLAITIAILSMLVASGCFVAANRWLRQ